MADSTLIRLAKDQLALPANAPDSVIPKCYIEELKLHLVLYPHDDNFRVILQPKHGLGVLTCLEQGCNNQTIALGKRVKAPDGGRREGFGSLLAYRNHIESHATHAKNRLARVKARLQTPSTTQVGYAPESSSAPVKREAIAPLLPSQVSRTSNRRSSGLVRIKPEIEETTISRKRLSDTAFDVHSVDKPVSIKKLKTDLTPKTPLAPLSNTFTTSELPISRAVPPPPDVQEIRARLQEVQTEIAATQTSLDRIKRKPKKSKADLAKINGYMQELQTLNMLKAEYNSSIPSMSPPKRTHSMASFYSPTKSENMTFATHNNADIITRPLPPIYRNPMFSVYEPFDAPVVKAETKPAATLFSNTDAWPATQPTPNPDPWVVTQPKFKRDPWLAAQPKPKPEPVEQKHFPMIDRNPFYEYEPEIYSTQPAASGSNVKLSPAPSSARMMRLQVEEQHFNPMIYPMKSAQPVASGSNVQLPYTPPSYMYSDSDEEMMPLIADDLIERVGIKAPAPMRNEHEDHNGDFYGRGRDLYVGPQAKADDIDKFLLEAGNAEQFDGNASVDKALDRVGLKSQYDLLPGMQVALMPHQTIGVAWMLDKEQSYFKGGCLADDMGLGKTIQMIAVIVKNQSTNPMCKTTLVIAPTALLDQWKMEIDLKTNCEMKCLIYHGPSKPRKKSEIMKYDIVLTTYTTMYLEWPDLEAQQKQKAKAKRQKKKDDFIVSDSEDGDDDKKGNKAKKQKGLLFDIDFYRIILDEAQAIRNRRTRQSRASSELSSTYRWCLTGTPIVNSLLDAYAYMRFLKIRPWYDYTDFRNHVGLLEKKNPALAVVRLQAIFGSFLLRRMKNSLLDGKRLIELPEKTVDLVKLEFSQEEREIYTMVEARSQNKFNRYLRAGTVLKNYHQVLVLLLRLRQLCSHPSLIQEDGIAFIHPDEVDSSKPELATELSRARRLVSPEFVTKMKERFREMTLTRMAAEKESADAALEDEDCPICFDALNDAVITPCTHIFCRECIIDVLNTVQVDGGDGPAKLKADERPCPVCRSAICKEKLFGRTAFEPSDADLNLTGEPDGDIEMGDSDDEPLQPKRRSKAVAVDSDDEPLSNLTGKGKAKAKKTKSKPRSRRLDADGIQADTDLESEDDDMSDFIVGSDEDEEEKDARLASKRRLRTRKAVIVLDSDEELDTPEEQEVIFGHKKKAPASEEAIRLMPRFLPSTKMKHMMEILMKGIEKQPEEKTLIISQWTGCLSLVSDYLTEKGIVHVKYQGDMNRNKRDQAVRVFMSKDKARVMLMSLKCGGVGLNLTRANNVISLDLGWSRAIEDQAFDRVHRLGQTRAVEVQRLVIADTVEDRLLNIQERKQSLADGSLGEGTGKKIGRLTVKELANLFGLDARGRRLARD